RWALLFFLLLAVLIVAGCVSRSSGGVTSGEPTPTITNDRTMTATTGEGASMAQVSAQLSPSGVLVAALWWGGSAQEFVLVLVDPKGEPIEIGRYQAQRQRWLPVPIDLLRVAGERLQAGTWRVRWLEAAQRRVVAEAPVTVTSGDVQRWRAAITPRPELTPRATAVAGPTAEAQRPTPTPVPPTWTVSSPSQPIQPRDCFTGAQNVVEVGIRNSSGRPGQSWQMIVQVINPAGDVAEFGPITVNADSMTRTQFDLCELGGTSALVGTWTVRWVDAGTRGTVYQEVTFEVLPVSGGGPASPPPQGSIDSDSDGLTDDDELSFGTDPYNRDTDGDGLTDGFEAWVFGSDPRKEDTDWDGTYDGAEYQLGSDPWDPCDPNPDADACTL
ncbi:MAG: hypothetical protein ACK42I_10105, partial [Thermomicrobium sp.]